MVDEAPQRRLPNWLRQAGMLSGTILLTAGVWGFWSPRDRRESVLPVTQSSLLPTLVSTLPPQPASPPPAEPPPPSLVGTWEDEFYGKRRLTFRDDGTADMVLELDPISRLVYGPRLTFYISWEQSGQTLTLRMTGGEPPEATAALAKLFGEASEQRIEALSADELRLRSLDSDKLYIHRRLTTSEEAAPRE